MKKRIIIYGALALLAICIISSCKKDPDPNNNGQNNELPSDTIPNGNDTIVPPGNDTIPTVIDRIVFGDTTGMIVTTYNSIMGFDESWHPIILDLNGDGTDDIKIETYYDGPLAIGEFQTLTLYCLNNRIRLLGDNTVKESYTHRDTIVEQYNDYTIITYSYIYSTCGKTAENDPVHTSNTFEIFANDVDDTFALDDHFQSTNITLFRQDVEYQLGNPNEDIVYVDHNKYIYHCWNFPTDEEKYIGFSITQHDDSRYGWLKIKLNSTWGGSVVDTELIETAIQK